MLRARAAVVLSVLAWSLLPAAAAAAAAEPGPGQWQWPLAGPQEVSRGFAPPASRYGAGHRGVDLPAEPGALVRAAGAGRVSYAGLLAGRGVVVVLHGDLRTTYEPVTSLHPVGTQVAAGDPVGRLEPGHLGCAAAACLHWGLRRGEQYLDPTRLVERRPVRLLPVPGPPAEPPVRQRADASLARAEPAPSPLSEELEASGPQWSLSAAEAPLGLVAVAALVLGLALLTRRRPIPPHPAGGTAAAAAAPTCAQPDPAPAAHQVLDLDAARLRRLAS